MDDLFQQGITAYKAGKQNEARRIFITVVKQSPDSERAWGWMNNVCNTDQERIHCLKQVLRINPKNEKARQHLERLLTPPFAAELPLSPVSSVPLSPAPSGSNARSRNSGFTQTQLFILLGLVVTVFFVFGVALLFLFVENDNANTAVAVSPTSFVPSSANNTPLPTQVQPAATLIPTYAYAPTWTPLPSPTSFVVATLVPPTAKPQQAQDNPAAAANPPAASSGSNCSSQLDYAAAMHQYNLDVIDYIHAPLISLYESWIDDATRNRDALSLVKAERELDNERAQVKAEKVTENKRYKAEQASINASCQ
jgi:hypothetical protein